MQNQVKSNLEEQESYTVKYDCNKCRDTTYILVGDEAFPCSCKEVRRAKKMLEKSGISEEFSKKTFDNFDYSRNVQTIDSYTVARSYVRDFDKIRNNRKNSVIFMGSVGGGKTHLSLAIANELMKKGVGVVYMGYRDCIIRFKQNIMDASAYESMMSRYKSCKVLLIDDLFKGSITSSDLNVIFEIVNHRYFNGLPVIVSCEMDVDRILSVDEAIGSRLVEMCKCVELKGKKLNYRMYGK